MSDDKLLIIGGGTMGEIFLQAALKLFHPKHITVAQRSAERREYLTATYHITTAELSTINLTIFDVVVVAVKPQDVMGLPISQALVISVMAGISTTRLQQLFSTPRVVRIMPNTPAKIGLGMSVWTATSATTPTDKQLIHDWLKLLGQELYVDNDDWIFKATAVSGSGPAYLFLFAEQLINAAKELGFNDIQAQQLVSQTLLGASQLLSQNNTNVCELRQKVTSKGGTTAAAINSLPQAELQQIWNTAVQAAYERAKEL